MGLWIYSSDEMENFYIRYMGFRELRGFFVLSKYGESLYEDYTKLVNYIVSCTYFDKDECPVNEDEFAEKLGDLNILIAHSDCDGELNSDECKLLEKVLIVDEEAIKNTVNYQNNPDYGEHMIKLMYEFIDLIKYCVKHDEVKLIFS